VGYPNKATKPCKQIKGLPLGDPWKTPTPPWGSLLKKSKEVCLTSLYSEEPFHLIYCAGSFRHRRGHMANQQREVLALDASQDDRDRLRRELEKIPGKKIQFHGYSDPDEGVTAI